MLITPAEGQVTPASVYFPVGDASGGLRCEQESSSNWYQTSVPFFSFSSPPRLTQHSWSFLGNWTAVDKVLSRWTHWHCVCFLCHIVKTEQHCYTSVSTQSLGHAANSEPQKWSVLGVGAVDHVWMVDYRDFNLVQRHWQNRIVPQKAKHGLMWIYVEHNQQNHETTAEKMCSA